jgi:hypothetical protein
MSISLKQFSQDTVVVVSDLASLLAYMAPSVGNPWQITIDEETLEIDIDCDLTYVTFDLRNRASLIVDGSKAITGLNVGTVSPRSELTITSPGTNLNFLNKEVKISWFSDGWVSIANLLTANKFTVIHDANSSIVSAISLANCDVKFIPESVLTVAVAGVTGLKISDQPDWQIITCNVGNEPKLRSLDWVKIKWFGSKTKLLNACAGLLVMFIDTDDQNLPKVKFADNSIYTLLMTN